MQDDDRKARDARSVRLDGAKSGPVKPLVSTPVSEAKAAFASHSRPLEPSERPGNTRKPNSQKLKKSNPQAPEKSKPEPKPEPSQNLKPKSKPGLKSKPSQDLRMPESQSGTSGPKEQAPERPGQGAEPQTQRQKPQPKQKPQPPGHSKPQPKQKPQQPGHSKPQPAPGEKTPPAKGGRFTRRQRSRVQRVRSWTVRAFCIVLALGMVVGLAFFARPTASAVENRNLTAFPTLTWESFWDGSFFTDLSLWYADTYPPREFIIGLDKGFKSLYGIQSEVTMVGGVEEAEEVPTSEQPQDVGTIDVEQFTAPEEDALAQEVQNNILNGLYVHNGAAYSKYYFTESVARKYASVVNTCAAKLEGKAQVFSVLVPDSSSVVLSDEELHAMGGSSESDAIRYYDSLMSDQVKKVDVFPTLKEHAGEYLYFRSDHHWTELGAYYAYVKFCEEAGIEPVSLDDKEMMEFDGFLGSFYQKLNDPSMAANPDTVDAHVPHGTNEMRYLDRNGEWIDAKVITDVSAWNKGSKYQTFIAGDQPLVEIVNPQIEDDSSVLLVKESFGNAFAPLLVDSFQRVYVIDYRYYQGNIVEFVEQNGIKDVVFMNNITHASTNGVVDKLASMM